MMSNNCFNYFEDELITEYVCKTTRTRLQWIVEPVVGQNTVRFSANENPGDTARVGNNIIGIVVSIFPLVSRLRITSDPSLPTADVVCLSDDINDTRLYSNDTFSKSHNIHLIAGRLKNG